MKNSLPDNDICSIIIIPMSQLDMHGFVWDTDVLQNEKRPLVWDMWFTQGVLLLLGLLKDFHSLFYCTEMVYCTLTISNRELSDSHNK